MEALKVEYSVTEKRLIEYATVVKDLYEREKEIVDFLSKKVQTLEEEIQELKNSIKKQKPTPRPAHLKII